MRRDHLRWILGALLLLIALNAFAGGYYGMSGAEGVPIEWLKGSPFADYFVPSLILFVVVGGAFLTAAIAVFARVSWRKLAVAVAVAIAIGWLATQIAIIGYVSWMQPATAVATIVAAILAAGLPPTRADAVQFAASGDRQARSGRRATAEHGTIAVLGRRRGLLR